MIVEWPCGCVVVFRGDNVQEVRPCELHELEEELEENEDADDA